MFKKIKYYKTFVNDLEKRINENQITEIKEYQLAISNFRALRSVIFVCM